MFRLCNNPQGLEYNVRTFYNSGEDDDYILKSLWDSRNLKLDPNYLPYKVLKTNLGELLIRKTIFKSRNYFLTLVGDHFVFIHNNERKVIPICLHLQ